MGLHYLIVRYKYQVTVQGIPSNKPFKIYFVGCKDPYKQGQFRRNCFFQFCGIFPTFFQKVFSRKSEKLGKNVGEIGRRWKNIFEKIVAANKRLNNTQTLVKSTNKFK